jgi:uncharacterized protein YqjF (DUF2071 family)
VLGMKWHDLAFLHWAVDPERLRALLPPGLELDLFEGRAYLGLVPFRMSAVTPRFFPSVPGLSAFPEMNIRTYVKTPAKPGVWFFSLDATPWVAVQLARRAFALPYYQAEMELRWERGWCCYRNVRGPVHFRGRYRPIGEPWTARPGSLEHWLTERYALFSYRDAATKLPMEPAIAAPPGQLFRGDIWHRSWSLQNGEVEIEAMDMVSWLGLELSGAPLVHFAQLQEVRAWLTTRVSLTGEEC